jgi:hypothetical protein
MRFQNERFWNTKNRLDLWTSNQYSSAITAADIRLERTKAKSTQKEPSPLCTAEREDANERLFRQIAENKKTAVSREEWLRMKETQKHNE